MDRPSGLYLWLTGGTQFVLGRHRGSNPVQVPLELPTVYWSVSIRTCFGFRKESSSVSSLIRGAFVHVLAMASKERRHRAVALVSGGKDSCHALALAYTLDCHVSMLAHVAPAGIEEPDFGESDDGGWMFQGAAHRATDAIATCVGRTLVRVKTCGDADEDLRRVLKAAMDRDGRINACLCGAVFSDYQRIRVERACATMGLLSLAPMWRIPQSILVRNMVNSGMKAAIVKVAGAGLAPMLLGMELHTPRVQKALRRAHEQYGAHVGGEGGEYESLALDCEAFAYARIEIVDAKVRVDEEASAAPGTLPSNEHTEQDVPEDCSIFVRDYKGIHSLDREGKPALLDVQKVRLVFKVDQGQIPADAKVVMVKPQDSRDSGEEHAARDSETVSCNNSREAVPTNGQHDKNLPDQDCSSTTPGHPEPLVWSSYKSQSRIFLHCRIPALYGVRNGLNAALKDVQTILGGHGTALKAAVFVTMYLKEMEDFPLANEVYSMHFPQVDPASRACVQAALPNQLCLALDILVPFHAGMEHACPSLHSELALDMDESPHPVLKRQVLHVQSISHWAPCCIGPYAQANAMQGILYVAGQLGLDAPSMTLPSENPVDQARLAARHCQSVAVVMKSSVRHCMLSCIVYVAEKAKSSLKGIEQVVFEMMSCDCVPTLEVEKDPNQLEPDEEEAVIHVYARKRWCPMVTFAVVPALPRGAAVEIQPLCFSPSIIQCAFDARQMSDEEDGDTRVPSRPWCKMLESESEDFGSCIARWICARQTLFLGSLSCHCDRLGSGVEVAQGLALLIRKLQDASMFLHDVYCLRIYYNSMLLEEDALGEVLRCTWSACHDTPFDSFAPVFVPVVGLAMETQPAVAFKVDLSAFHA